MGFGRFLKGIATGGLSEIGRGSKNPLVSVLAGMPMYNPFGRAGGGRPGMPPVNPNDLTNAKQFLGTFSPEDQANISAGVSSPNQFVDWYRGASQAAGWQPSGGGGFGVGSAAAPMFSGGGSVGSAAAPLYSQVAAMAPPQPAAEQPTDYAALEEERKRKQAQRANWAVNKPPVA